MQDDCATKYPIVLIHGAGFRDLKWPVYWGRIPSRLEARGARIHYGLQDCWASVETNARAIAARIAEITEQTGCGKVNIIAHSKGGLDARMAASQGGCADRIEGPNDGLVSVASAQWGENFRVVRSSAFRGISHLDAIDLRRSPFSRRKTDGISDICDLYIDIVKDLKSRGF